MTDFLVNSIAELKNFARDLQRHNLATKRIDLSIGYLEQLIHRRDLGLLLTQDGAPSWRHFREVVEADELISIHAYLAKNFERVGVQLWDRIMEQPSDPWEETDAFPRSFQYELWLTSWLHRAGVSAAWFGENIEPDCRFNFCGEEIVVEAKRPLRTQSVGNAIDRARKQLADRLRAERSKLGLIAISLSVPILCEMKTEAIKRGEDVLPAGDREAIAKHGIEFIAALVPLITNSLQRVVGTERTLGVLFTANYPAVELRPDQDKDGVAYNTVGSLIETTRVPEYQSLTTALLDALHSAETAASLPGYFALGAGERLKEALEVAVEGQRRET